MAIRARAACSGGEPRRRLQRTVECRCRILTLSFRRTQTPARCSPLHSVTVQPGPRSSSYSRRWSPPAPRPRHGRRTNRPCRPPGSTSPASISSGTSSTSSRRTPNRRSSSGRRSSPRRATGSRRSRWAPSCRRISRSRSGHRDVPRSTVSRRSRTIARPGSSTSRVLRHYATARCVPRFPRSLGADHRGDPHGAAISAAGCDQ